MKKTIFLLAITVFTTIVVLSFTNQKKDEFKIDFEDYAAEIQNFSAVLSAGGDTVSAFNSFSAKHEALKAKYNVEAETQNLESRWPTPQQVCMIRCSVDYYLCWENGCHTYTCAWYCDESYKLCKKNCCGCSIQIK